MGSQLVGDQPDKTPGVGNSRFPSVGMAVLWTLFLYFNLQLIVLFVTQGFLIAWVEGRGEPFPKPRSLEALRLQLWAQIAALPLQWLLIRFLAGTFPFRLGKFPRIGSFLLGFFLVSGFCHLLNWGLTSLMSGALNLPVPKHPLTRFGADAVLLWDWLVLTLSACLVAPINEELLFRRVLPQWMDLNQGPRAVGILAVVTGLLLSETSPQLGLLFPICSLVWHLGLWLLIEWNRHWQPSTRMMIASSALFGAIHSFAWPTPIPLFFFALWQFRLVKEADGVGPAVVFHSLFNAIGVVTLFLGNR